MDYQKALEIAAEALLELKGHNIDVITISKPIDIQAAIAISKILSKLSPIIGNLIEYVIANHLNIVHKWPNSCEWTRQDPGFPDTILSGMSGIKPGIEVKTWFPLATEITARFRESQTHLQKNHIKIILVCWLLEDVIAGKPKILDIWIGDALEVAQFRDRHYHNPPEYVVMEPEDTRSRTRNLQQTNCHGYRFQGTKTQLMDAEKLVDSWGENAKEYSADPNYQMRLRKLIGSFPYRLDTNFAKMDRISLPSLEIFKGDILQRMYAGRTIQEWTKAIKLGDRSVLQTLILPSANSPLD